MNVWLFLIISLQFCPGYTDRNPESKEEWIIDFYLSDDQKQDSRRKLMLLCTYPNNLPYRSKKQKNLNKDSIIKSEKSRAGISQHKYCK